MKHLILFALVIISISQIAAVSHQRTKKTHFNHRNFLKNHKAKEQVCTTVLENRDDCGSQNIGKEECLSMNCCYEETSDENVPNCFDQDLAITSDNNVDQHTTIPPPFLDSEAHKLWRLVTLGYCKENDNTHFISQWNYNSINEEFRNNSEFLSITPANDVIYFHGETGWANIDMQDSGYLVYEAETNTIYLTLRGTVPWKIQNIITDLNIFTKTEKIEHDGQSYEFKMHNGFFRAYERLRKTINTNLRNMMNAHPNAKLHITGHSLGGALANHAALRIFMDLNVQPDLLYTFGQPKMANADFHDFIKNFALKIKNTYRITHWRDIVPNIPPSIMWLTPYVYTHPEVYYSGPNFYICQNSKEQKCKNKFYWGLGIYSHQTYMQKDISKDILGCGLLGHDFGRFALDFNKKMTNMKKQQRLMMIRHNIKHKKNQMKKN